MSLTGNSLRDAAVSGGAWSLIQVVVNKLASLAGTFALMYLLVPADYATASLALSAQALLSVLPPFTLGDALIARSGEVERLMGTAVRICAAVSVATAALLVGAGPWAAEFYDDRALVLAFGCVAFRPLVELALLGPQTRLRVRLAFKRLALVDAGSQLGATVLSVIMAATGFDWWSLLVPQIAFTAVRAAAYSRAAAPVKAEPRWLPDEVRSISAAYAWSGLGQYVHGAVLMLPPLVIGWFCDNAEVGFYAMAFTLSASINSVVAVSMGIVLQPIFANMAGDRARQLAAFTRSGSVIALVAMPLCICQAAVVGPAIRTLLPDRWAGSVDMAVLMSVGQAFYFAVNPAMSLLKAQGRFTAFFAWQAVQLVIVAVAMAAAGSFGSGSPALAITAVASLYTVVSSPLGVWLCLRGVHGAGARSMALFARPFAAAALAFVPVVMLLRWLGPTGMTGDLLQLGLVPVLGFVAYVGLVWVLDRPAVHEAIHLIKQIHHRLAQPSRA